MALKHVPDSLCSALRDSQKYIKRVKTNICCVGMPAPNGSPNHTWQTQLACTGRLHEMLLCCRILLAAENPDAIQWLQGAKFNIAEAALCSRQADATAIVWADESAPSQVATVSLGQLKQRCQHVAAALATAGFRPG